LALHGANFSRSSIPGIAMKAHPVKNQNHPVYSAMNPVGAESTSRPKAMKLVNSAYWVAVNFLFVMLAINAMKAAVPIPPLRFSKPITTARAGMLWPKRERTAKPAVDTA